MSNNDHQKDENAALQKSKSREKKEEALLKIIFEEMQEHNEREIEIRISNGTFSEAILRDKICAGQNLDDIEKNYVILAIHQFHARKKRRGNKSTRNSADIGEAIYESIEAGNTVDSALLTASIKFNLSKSHVKKLWTGIKGVNPFHEERMAGIRSKSREQRRQNRD